MICAQSHPEIRVALEGDLVYVHFDCTDETGEVRDVMILD